MLDALLDALLLAEQGRNARTDVTDGLTETVVTLQRNRSTSVTHANGGPERNRR